MNKEKKIINNESKIVILNDRHHKPIFNYIYNDSDSEDDGDIIIKGRYEFSCSYNNCDNRKEILKEFIKWLDRVDKY